MRFSQGKAALQAPKAKGIRDGMASNLITNDELRGMRVMGGKKGSSRIGKIRRMVFHPRERRVVGFIVKRPDLALMFHRKDLFVSLQGFDFVDGRVVVRQTSDATDKGACKALGIDYDSCVMWEGLPLMTESGEVLGTVGTVTFDRSSGAVSTVLADAGATANTLLGTRVIPVSYIKGFRRGVGVALAQRGHEGDEQDEEEIELGAILVSDKAKKLAAEGSVAEKAGAATAVAVNKVNTAVKPAVANAAKATTHAVGEGVRAVGKRVEETKGAFGAFKDEYDKARGSRGDGSVAKGGAGSSKGTASKAPVKKSPTKKNMFAAFKDEYDKARHCDE